MPSEKGFIAGEARLCLTFLVNLVTRRGEGCPGWCVLCLSATTCLRPQTQPRSRSNLLLAYCRQRPAEKLPLCFNLSLSSLQSSCLDRGRGFFPLFFALKSPSFGVSLVQLAEISCLEAYKWCLSQIYAGWGCPSGSFSTSGSIFPFFLWLARAGACDNSGMGLR